MVDISSQNNKINITVTSSGNTANTNVTPDYAQYYSEKSKEWAIGNRIVDNTDYSSKYYANESKKQADISTAKATEVVESGNTAVSNIEIARDNAIFDVNTAGATQVNSVNTAGITQVANVNYAGTTQINLAKEQVTLATEQANIATQKAEEIKSLNLADYNLSNITDSAKESIKELAQEKVESYATTVNEQLANKLDLDAQNLSIEGKSLISSLGMPSTKFIDLTLGASGSSYTAPANGWFMIKGTFRYLEMSNKLPYVAESNVSTAYKGGFVPYRKGESVVISYDITPTSYKFRFVYAEGEV